MGLLDAIPRDLGRIQKTEKGTARDIFFRPQGAPEDGLGDLPVRAPFGDVYAPEPAPGGRVNIHAARKEILVQKSSLPQGLLPRRGKDSFVIDGLVYDVILVNDDGYDLLIISLGRREGRNMQGWSERP